jgi:hypothetical protein
MVDSAVWIVDVRVATTSKASNVAVWRGWIQ